MTRVLEHILLVDDSDDDEFFFRRALQQGGIGGTCHRLASGGEALEFFAAGPGGLQPWPDIVFLDIKMPMVSGFEVLEWVRTHPLQPPPIFVIMLSSSSERRDRERAQELGAHGYAVKPANAALFEQLARQHDFSWPKVDGT